MAIIRVNAGVNEELNTRRSIERARDGDTISVPNERCANIVRAVTDKLLFVEVRK